MQSKLLEKYGPWAIVTGASAGLGESFARELAAHGFSLVLTARRKERLQALAKSLKEEYSIETKVVVLDLTKDDVAQELSQKTKQLDIGLLVSNAGFGAAGDFLKIDEKNTEMVKLNALTVMQSAREFGSRMQKRERSGMILVSSIVAYQSNPWMAVYSATKAFVLFLGEALRYEWKQYNIDVLTVSPGATATEFAEVAGMAQPVKMKPEKVVRGTLRNLGKRSVYVPGIGNKLLTWVSQRVPRSLAVHISAWLMKSLGRDK